MLVEGSWCECQGRRESCKTSWVISLWFDPFLFEGWAGTLWMVLMFDWSRPSEQSQMHSCCSYLEIWCSQSTLVPWTSSLCKILSMPQKWNPSSFICKGGDTQTYVLHIHFKWDIGWGTLYVLHPSLLVVFLNWPESFFKSSPGRWTQGKHSTTWATPPILLLLAFFSSRVSCFCE
jgi:hypothetical protein